MARYRKISPTIWSDARFRTLSDDAQLVFLYLLTHPHQTSLGGMRASVPGLAAEKCWRLPRFAKAFSDIEARGMLRHDPDASLVWLPNFLKHNPPENPNVIKSWVASLDLLPECGLKAEIVDFAKGFTEGLPQPFREALPQPFRKGMPNQEQEQEQEQEKIGKAASNFCRPLDKTNCKSPAAAPQDFDRFYRAYPRHVARTAALKAWLKLKPSDELTSEILAAVDKQIRWRAEEVARNLKIFIPDWPHPATWLAGERWMDELASHNDSRPQPRGLQEIPTP